MILQLAKRGGVMGLNFCGSFLADRDDHKSCVDDMVKHILYIKDLAGIDVIGLGTDFDGISCPLEIENASMMNLLEEALFEIDVFGIKQFNVNGYRVDFYIPEFKLAVEYDEQQHNYMEKQDLDRQLIISKELDCEFIRCDYKESDIKNVMNVLKKINFGGNK